MAYSIFRVIGQVVNRRTKQGVLGLRVEAWDKDQKYHDLLGVGITGRGGHFMITFDQTYFREFAPEKFPDLFFKIFHGQKLLRSTEDSVIWNAKKATEVTIDIELPAPDAAGKDRVSARQVFKTVDFVQRSDFRGLLKETEDKAGAAFGFLADMVTNTISKMDIEPIRPPKLKTFDVINKDIPTAQKNLEAQKITINEVRPYKPSLNKESIANLATFPVTLQPGQKINLYEENGKVSYYSVVEEDETAELKDKVDKTVVALENLDASFVQKTADYDSELAAIKEQLSQIEKMKIQLEETILKDSQKKEDQIAELKKQLNEQRTHQDEIIKKMIPETVERFEKNISELKSAIEKIQKNHSKTKTTTKRSTRKKTATNDKT